MKTVFHTFLVGILFLSASCTSENKPAETKHEFTSHASVERGKYLVNAIGCDDCHSPKRMGAKGPEIIEELRFSGYPADSKLPEIDQTNLKNGWVLFSGDLTSAVGPWGVSYAANISSDATGIGNWTEENFMIAIRKGKYKGLEGGRNLLPPMPWNVYRNLSDDDLKSIFAYLKTTAPVKNVVPAPLSPDMFASK
jgi:hypothetical protein